jgi:hypothetical protein
MLSSQTPERKRAKRKGVERARFVNSSASTERQLFRLVGHVARFGQGGANLAATFQ